MTERGMSIEKAKAELKSAMSGSSSRYWNYTPAVSAVLAALEQAEKRIAELEARTLTVKLPDYRATYKEAFASEVEHHVRTELEKLARSVGISLKIEGE